MLIMSATPPADLPTAHQLYRLVAHTARSISPSISSLASLPSRSILPPLLPSFVFPNHHQSLINIRPPDRTALPTRACRPIPCLRTQSRARTEVVESLYSQIQTLVILAATMVFLDHPTPTLRPPTRPCRTPPLHRCLHQSYIVSLPNLPIRL